MSVILTKVTDEALTSAFGPVYCCSSCSPVLLINEADCASHVDVHRRVAHGYEMYVNILSAKTPTNTFNMHIWRASMRWRYMCVACGQTVQPHLHTACAVKTNIINATLQGAHNRTGVNSPIILLSQFLLRDILRFTLWKF